jgi:hypothetical protein
MFSTILDISSFFIGMLINLLLIALICYYFKRKYETLEASQNEQAKILYNLIQNQLPKKTFNINDLLTTANVNMCPSLNNVMINPDEIEESDSDDETDAESDDESESDNESNSETVIKDEIKQINLEVSEITEIPSVKLLDVTEVSEQPEVEELEPILVNKLDSDEVTDYSKLSIKQLKDILTKKGINSNHRMKKTDLINLIEHGHNENTLNLKDEIEEVNI